MNNPTIVPELSHRQRQYILWTALCLMPIMGMGIDLVAPSLPAIKQSLHISQAAAKNVFASYLFGYAIGNFLTGFISDAVGRQRILQISLFGFMLTSLIPVFFPAIGFLILARLLQGFTIGAVSVVVRSIFADVLSAEELVRFGTLVGAMWGLGPVIGPLIGGYLQVFFGWQAGFCFFAIVSFLGFIATLIFIPETHFQRQPLNLNRIKTNLFTVLRHQSFITLVCLMGLSYSLIISFNTAGPFLIQTQMHHSPVFFGHIALWLGITFLSATFACRYLLKIISFEGLLALVVYFTFLFAILGFIINLFFENTIPLIIIFTTMMFFNSGFIFPMSMGKCLSYFRHIAGTATATMYLINMIITSGSAFLVSFIHTRQSSTLMLIYLILSTISTLIFGLLLQKSLK